MMTRKIRRVKICPRLIKMTTVLQLIKLARTPSGNTQVDIFKQVKVKRKTRVKTKVESMTSLATIKLSLDPHKK